MTGLCSSRRWICLVVVDAAFWVFNTMCALACCSIPMLMNKTYSIFQLKLYILNHIIQRAVLDYLAEGPPSLLVGPLPDRGEVGCQGWVLEGGASLRIKYYCPLISTVCFTDIEMCVCACVFVCVFVCQCSRLSNITKQRTIRSHYVRCNTDSYFISCLTESANNRTLRAVSSLCGVSSYTEQHSLS